MQNRRKNKNLTRPHLKPNQSKKLIKNKGQTSIYNFVQDHKLHTEEYFNLWTENSSLSNVILFLSFHIAHKRHKGASFQVFLLFLPTKDPHQPRKVSLTEQGRTQVTPKRANNNSHKTLILMQWIKVWLVNFSSARQKKHLLARDWPFLLSWSKVKTFPQEASQSKKNPLLEEQKGSKLFFLETGLYFPAPQHCKET